jgi:glutathione S-transferase
MKIYGDLQSGNCLKVKYTADHLGLTYSWVPVDITKGESRSADYLRLYPQGQVPAIELDDGRRLGQSNAIIRYLARDSALLPVDAFAQAKVDELLFWEQYSHEPYIAVRRFQLAYLGKKETDLDPRLLANGLRALGQMEAQLARTQFIAGDRLTVADIALVAYTRVAHEGGFDLDEFPNLRRWITHVERDLSIASQEAA